MTERRDVGIRLIVFYKAAKSLVEMALAVALVALAALGEIEALREMAGQLKSEVASRWSLFAGRALAALVSERGVHLLEIGLALDAFVSAIEGWSLWRGYRWGPWLVVAATAIPLPLEALEIARKVRPARVLLAAINLAVVAYLARRIARRRGRNPTWTPR